MNTHTAGHDVEARTFHLITPISDETIKRLHVGDVVYVSGAIFTARDMAHRRILEEKPAWTNEIRSGVVYHCGPIVKNGTVVSAGPTTSARLNTLTPDFLALTGAKLLIGKGGMDENVLRALEEHTAAYGVFPGGSGALAAKSLRRKKVYLEDLGMPEAVWVFEARDFGPVFITMDAHGNSLHQEVEKTVKDNLLRLFSP